MTPPSVIVPSTSMRSSSICAARFFRAREIFGKLATKPPQQHSSSSRLHEVNWVTEQVGPVYVRRTSFLAKFQVSGKSGCRLHSELGGRQHAGHALRSLRTRAHAEEQHAQEPGDL